LSFEQVVRIPVERVGVIIGKEGSTKKHLEERMGVQLDVDGVEGTVVVRSSSIEQVDPFSAVRVIEAIGRGFSPARAKRLLEEGTSMELIDLRDYAGKSSNSIERIRGRIIGLKGKSRRVIEELTRCFVSVYGRSVAIIGETSEVELASEAVKMLASGSQHRTVFNTLQKARTKRKMERMLLWEGMPQKIAEELRNIDT
jgi:ribosomal RNA assembly protein